MRVSTMRMGWTAWWLLAAACGDNGGGTVSEGGGSTSVASGSTGATATATEGGASASGTTTGPTEGGGSISDSNSTTGTSVTTSVSDSNATDGGTTTGTASETNGGSTAGTDPGETTQGGSISDGSTGTTDVGTGSTTDEPPPLCGMPPGGFNGPKNESCAIPPKVGTFTPVTEWSKNSWAVSPTYNQVMASPIVVSLTDDNQDGKINDQDIPDIVFTTFAGGAYQAAGVLRAVSGDNGAEILNINNENIGGTAGVAGGDIDGDGIAELVTTTTNGQVKAFEHTGQLKWATPAGTGPNLYSYPAIADMDGDGKPEIISGAAILNNDGTLRGKVKYGYGRLVAVAADMNQDGTLEMIGGNAIYKPDASEVWYNQQTDGWVAVADVDVDSSPDIVVVAAPTVRLQNAAGAVLWTANMPGGGGGPPTIADYDGDGQPENGVAGAAAYVVFESNGQIRWQKATQDASSQVTGSSVFDFEGDGAAEAVYNDEVRLRVYAGTNGAEKLNILGHGSGTLYEYPIVVDVDGDGQTEIVVTNNNYAYGTKTGVTVIGDQNKSWRPGRRIWNQHAYSITNVNDDGTIPADVTPNFKVHNSFRSGDLAPPDGTDTPDLRLKAATPCELQCKEGKLVVYVHIGNEGASPLTAGATIDVVGLSGGQIKTMQSVEYADPIDPGKYAPAIAVEIDPTDLDSIEVKIKAKEQECDVDNNTVAVPGPFCNE
jgi:hypothetical protein